MSVPKVLSSICTRWRCCGGCGFGLCSFNDAKHVGFRIRVEGFETGSATEEYLLSLIDAAVLWTLWSKRTLDHRAGVERIGDHGLAEFAVLVLCVF